MTVINNIYYEQCNNESMITTKYFYKKLNLVQKLSKCTNTKIINKINKINKQTIDPINNRVTGSINSTNPCAKCQKKEYYMIKNILWDNTLAHKIKNHNAYPSNFFVKIISNLAVYDNNIINPPIVIPKKLFNSYNFVTLGYNQLLIIDALMHQGSYPRYLTNNRMKNLYSEHSGAISVSNGQIDNIIVSAESNRLDNNDSDIYLPQNTSLMSKYSYIFHTHPNTIKYAGRIDNGIIYEFPSANDMFNFIKYYNESNVQSSIVITPEGTYVIRPIVYVQSINPDITIFYEIQDHLLLLEKQAIKKFSSIKNISDPDIFHANVSSDFTFIKSINKLISKLNLFIEFYPRIKLNNRWYLKDINLPYIAK